MRMPSLLHTMRLPLPLKAAAKSAGDAGAEAVIAALSPVGWYKFDEGTGSTVTDYGSAGADLTLSGSGGAWVTGGHDSQGTAYWAAGATLGISGTGARTLICVGAPQLDPLANHNVFGAEWPGSGGNGTRWSLRNIGGGSGDLRLEIAGAGFTETTFALANGEWVFTAASMATGGDALEDCDLYYNGSTVACTGTSVTINTAGNFAVGRSASTVNDWIAGYCLVFNTELSAATIASIRTALTTIMAARGITLP